MSQISSSQVLFILLDLTVVHKKPHLTLNTNTVLLSPTFSPKVHKHTHAHVHVWKK